MQGVDVFLLTGFLGAGKTTLLKRLLAHPWEGKSAIVVNEFGSVGIDGEEVRRNTGFDLVEIKSGCVCCTLRGEFVQSFQHLTQTVRPDRVFVEASGVSEPSQIFESLQTPELKHRIGGIRVITVVDATFFPKRELLAGFYERQMEQARVILLNKTDCVEPARLEEIEAEVETLSPAASVLRTCQCEVDLDLLLGLLAATPVDSLTPNPVPAERFGEKPEFTTFSVQGNGTVPEADLRTFLENHAETILRAKGRVNTDQGPRLVSSSSHGLDFAALASPLDESCLVFVLGQESAAEPLQTELQELLDTRLPSK